jgi:dolichol kinase
MQFIAEIPFALLIIGAIITGLYLANYFYDKGVEQYISRKVGHGVGGVGILLCAFLFSSFQWPLLLSAGFTMILGGARLFKPEAFRGVGGTGRAHALAEVYFPAAATISIGVGWGWLGNPWLAVVPILFMAWGDMLTGIVRSRFYGREVKGNLGSIAMIVVCLLVAYLFKPYFIGAIGAVVATLVERFTPLSKGLWDDNWTIPIASLATMAVLLYLT